MLLKLGEEMDQTCASHFIGILLLNAKLLR